MKLILTLDTQDPQARPEVSTMTLDQHGITIGRSAMNEWVLPDPNRHISNYHCVIDFENGEYVLRDTSTNGVFLNGAGQPIGRGNAEILQEGDVLRFGPYEISVQCAEDDQFGADVGGGEPAAEEEDFGDFNPFTTGGPAAGPAPMYYGGAEQRSGDALRQVERDQAEDFDPFGYGAEARRPESFESPSTPAGYGNEEGFGRRSTFERPPGTPRQVIPEEADFGVDADAGWEGSSESDHVRAENEYFTPPAAKREGGGRDLIPEDWDFMDEAAAPPPAPAPPTPAPPTPAPSDRRGAPSRPTPPDRGPPSRGAGAPPPRRSVFDDEPEAEAGDAAPPPSRRSAAPPPPPPPPPSPPPPAPATDDWGALDEDLEPEPERPPAPVRPTPGGRGTPAAASGRSSAPPSRTSPPDDQSFVAAFMAGARLDHLDLSADSVAGSMRSIGATFREMVQGLRDVLTARTSTKREFNIDQTMLQATENNPLKFSVNVEEAMTALLVRQGSGYLPAERAVHQAFQDIKAHELAMLAGMQVAIAALLKRFDPEQLQKRMEQYSVFDNILPGNRKAKYWDLFVEQYLQIAREAEDDFQSLFGREFARAYQEQVKRL